MDYQIVFKRHSLINLVLIFATLHCAFAIVNRDLVLTPKQGLQLSGKRIFYDENTHADATLRNNNSYNDNSAAVAAARPWERTLKHVTYLTLFTNDATGIITGNFSKVKEYNDFLQSTYVRTPNPIDSRFGDIVTLAQGRLESMPSGLYRFVEGNCDYDCARENNMVATWHVQKIRHRDVDRKFHYEMKFSVSPMTATTPSETVVRGGPNKRTIMEQHHGTSNNNNNDNNIQTFIQKEDDYPHSFSKILSSSSNLDDDFAERRYDASRNFRQVKLPPQQQQHHTQATPMPQSTFLRGVYRPPPSAHMVSNVPSFPEHLNIGEYYKGSYGPKASPKIELFPNLLTMMFGKPHNYQKSPTTFRPPTTYQQMKFPRPEVYTAPPANPSYIHHAQDPNPSFIHRQGYTPNSNPSFIHPQEYTAPTFVSRQEYTKLPESYNSQEQFASKEPHNPVITHHYHHHYFMANSSDSAEHHSANSGEVQGVTRENDVHVVTPQPHFTQAYNGQQHHATLGQQHYQQQQQLTSHQHQQFHKPGPPPAPQKFVFPIAEIEQHRVVHVTPVPTLRKPQYQQYYQPFDQAQYITGHGPHVIYPAPVEEEKIDVPTPRNKPFVQSQPMAEEATIRYSEPDPLYAQINEKEGGEGQEHVEGGGEPQLELPENYDHQTEQGTEANLDTTQEHSNSVEAQVQAPRLKSNVIEFYEGDDDAAQEVSTQQTQLKQDRYEQKTSHTTNIKISTEKPTERSIQTEATNKVTLADTTTSTTTPPPKPKLLPTRGKRLRVKVTKLTTSTTDKPKIFSTTHSNEDEFTSTSSISTTTSTTSKPTAHKHFISSSTTESHLKSLSRYRSSNKRTSTSTTTTTEKPVLKWKPRRKEATGKSLSLKHIAQGTVVPVRNEAKASIREITKVPTPLPSQPTTAKQPEATTEMSNALTIHTSTMSSSQQQPPSTTSESEIYEVLTQKSISYKVGENGQEIPLIFNEAENEVKA